MAIGIRTYRDKWCSWLPGMLVMPFASGRGLCDQSPQLGRSTDAVSNLTRVTLIVALLVGIALAAVYHKRFPLPNSRAGCRMPVSRRALITVALYAAATVLFLPETGRSALSSDRDTGPSSDGGHSPVWIGTAPCCAGRASTPRGSGP
jgi:hypothetical protein